jgi:ElaB/YqjD/DUF883 family membrane-anchored ribosome-binding protein
MPNEAVVSWPPRRWQNFMQPNTCNICDSVEPPRVSFSIFTLMNFNPSHSTPVPSDQHMAAAKQAAAQASAELKAAAHTGVQQFRAAADDKVEDLQEAAQSGVQQLRETVGQKAAELGQYADQTWSAVRDQSKQATDQAVHYTQENPFRVVGFAFGLGLLVGLLAAPARD